MPIEGPNHRAKARGRVSEFVLCSGFVFRPRRVDAFSHRMIGDAAITTVLFQGYTQEILDPERTLYEYLLERLRPDTVDEAS